MSAPSVSLTPLISPAEMQVLVSRAGLSLNPGQMADLVLAWRQVARLLALVRRDRPLADDQAYVFKLPPPGATPAGKPVAARRPARPRKPAKTTKPRGKPAPRGPARRKR